MSHNPSHQRYRERLLSLRAALLAQEDTNAQARETVELDQSSVGRLSRMDALQQQAMAQATAQNRRMRLQAIEQALARIATGEYGYCSECGEVIPAERLDIAPTASRCVDCS